MERHQRQDHLVPGYEHPARCHGAGQYRRGRVCRLGGPGQPGHGQEPVPEQRQLAERPGGPAEYAGGLYAIPELAGDRVVVYNKAMFKKAGIAHTPTTLQELLGDGAALKNAYKNVPNFSAFYLPGEEWYAAMPFVWAYGGEIAIKSGGKWEGDLQAPKSIAGLQEYQAVQNFMSTPASDDVNEATPSDSQICASGKAAMYIDGTWTLGTDVADNKAIKNDIGTFALPGVTAGTQAPVFLGGSDLGIAKHSANRAKALAW